VTVENIFINGQLYKVESYAYGIATPVMAADEFHQVLLKWNAATAPGKFAPGSEVPIEAKRPKHRTLLSEAPIEAIWLRLRQLASVTLARKLLDTRARDAGVALDAAVLDTKAEGVAFALRNAIDYFHVRDGQNVSQRVLKEEPPHWNGKGQSADWPIGCFEPALTPLGAGSNPA